MPKKQTQLTVLASKKFVITVEANSKRFKIASIFFDVRGGVYLSTPYYRHTKGIVSKATLHRGLTYPATVTLKEGGRASSHLVKLSFHADGETHFSQDKKVFTAIRKKCEPLGEKDGHLFTVMAHGLNDFQPAQGVKDLNQVSARRAVVNFDFGKNMPTGIKMVGYWNKIDNLNGNPGLDGKCGPQVILRGADDKKSVGGFLLAPPLEQNPQSILLLTCEETPGLNNESSVLSVIGGFDPLSVVNNHSVDTSLLVFVYPSDNHAALVQELGSIDLK